MYIFLVHSPWEALTLTWGNPDSLMTEVYHRWPSSQSALLCGWILTVWRGRSWVSSWHRRSQCCPLAWSWPWRRASPSRRCPPGGTSGCPGWRCTALPRLSLPWGKKFLKQIEHKTTSLWGITSNGFTVTWEIIWIPLPSKHVLRNIPLVVGILDWNGITDQASHQKVRFLVGLDCGIKSVKVDVHVIICLHHILGFITVSIEPFQQEERLYCQVRISINKWLLKHRNVKIYLNFSLKNPPITWIISPYCSDSEISCSWWVSFTSVPTRKTTFTFLRASASCAHDSLIL